ncbi:MAG TPA: hypothetical protein VNJ01_10620 [Bacteriovoracaceae bacterium]|nr:hypothetical protein [Bacteriovoracaceae bacterium]
MLKLLFFAGLFSFQAFAVTPLLEKHVQSGLMVPENSFEYDCSINNDRHVVITRREGIGTAHTHTHHISRATRRNIRSLVHIAADGLISEAPVSCDGGDKLLYGFHHGEKFILDEDLDCGTHKINRSQAATALKRIARRYCGF